MESFATVQENLDAATIAVNIRIDKDLNDRLEEFMFKTVRSKSNAIKYLLLKGFERIEEMGIQE